jgi:hypothetical protein
MIAAMDNLGITTMDESFDKLIEGMGKIDEANWGPWKLVRETRNICMQFPPATYHLPITDLQPSFLFATLRDLEKKTWADNDCLGGLVRASFALAAAKDDPLWNQK